MSLFKQIHEAAFPDQVDPVKKAISEMTRPSPKEEMIRIADHWRSEGADIETDELREKIAMDFEMLEYGPEEISNLTTAVLKLIGRAI